MMAEKMVSLLSEIAPFFLIVGNHDRPNNSDFLTDNHAFNAMKKWDNVTIVDKVIDYNFKDFYFILVPYVPPGRFEEALNTLSLEKDVSLEKDLLSNATCIFAHQEIFNAKMGAIISQCGDKWDLNNPLMISGHIHSFDQLQPNMIYTGSPIQHTYSEENKTVSYFKFTKYIIKDTKDNNTKDKWEHERIDLGMIKKVTIYITPEQVLNYEVPTDKLVKLVVKGEEAAIKTIAKLDKIQELKKNNVKVVFKTIQVVEVSKQTQPKMSYKDRLYKELGRD